MNKNKEKFTTNKRKCIEMLVSCNSKKNIFPVVRKRLKSHNLMQVEDVFDKETQVRLQRSPIHPTSILTPFYLQPTVNAVHILASLPNSLSYSRRLKNHNPSILKHLPKINVTSELFQASHLIFHFSQKSLPKNVMLMILPSLPTTPEAALSQSLTVSPEALPPLPLPPSPLLPPEATLPLSLLPPPKAVLPPPPLPPPEAVLPPPPEATLEPPEVAAVLQPPEATAEDQIWYFLLDLFPASASSYLNIQYSNYEK